MDFNFKVGFRWPWWVYVWVSTTAVGLASGFNGGGGFGIGSPLLPFASYFYGFVKNDLLVLV
uniref:Uncharacterized protein n=1 Tax=Fagus sylvatica TaxID=28930 RepID=A0A2N9G566_FAGSY